MPKSERAGVDAEIGKLIAEARKRQKVSRDKAAEMLGLSTQMLQKHERGITPITVNRLLQLTEALGIPLSDCLPGAKSRAKKELIVVNTEEQLLVRAYREIPGGGMKSKAVELFQEMAKSGKTGRGRLASPRVFVR
jgi:transcriptional regulator with XRE-family HTH domain